MEDKKIKVMHILLSLDYGGAEKVVINLLRKMDSKKFDFSVCTLDRLGDLKDELSGDIAVTCMNRRNGLDLMLPGRLSRSMKMLRPDIVHMHNPTSLLYGVIAGKMARVPHMIVTQHGKVLNATKSMKTVTKKILCLVDKTVSVSSNITRYISGWNGLKKDSIKTITNGIDEKIYRPDEAKRIKMRLELGVNDKIVIGHIARLSEEKDQKTLLAAFSEVSREVDNTVLLIAGDGLLREPLKDLAAALGISDKVIFTGFQNNIPNLLNSFDIFVLSSIREGTSLTLIEAMATALPIVATDVGGNPDLVTDKNTGLLVPPRDQEKLSQAIVFLCRNPKIREEMGLAGRRSVEEKFSLNVMAEKYSELYMELAHK